MPSRDEDYQRLVETLEGTIAFANKADAADHIAEYRREHRVGITLLLMMLKRLGLVGDTTILHSNPPSTCDECDRPLRELEWFVDGRTDSGVSANMCPPCFWRRGHSLGWGYGQLYWKVSGGGWRLVAGGDSDQLEAIEAFA